MRMMRMRSQRHAVAALLLPLLLTGGAARAQEAMPEAAKKTERAALGPIADPTPEAKALALEVARLTHTEGTIIRAVSGRERAAFLELARDNEDFAGVEREHPGFIEAIWSEVEPVLDRSARERLPALIALQAETYAANLGADDLRWMRCTRTVLGEDGITSIADNASIDNIVASMKESGDFTASPEALRRDFDASRIAAAKAIGQDKVEAIMAACPRTSPPPDTRALSYALNQNVMNWSLGETDWEAAEMDRALDRALTRVGAK